MRLCHCSLLAALLLALVLGCAAKTKFDFFYHVQQWPGSYCDTKHCCFPHGKKPAADFGIHGMWPNYAKCPHAGKCWPEFCDCNDQLDETLIEDLKDKLRRNWGTLSCRKHKLKRKHHKCDNEQQYTDGGMAFWGHEWLRHGTCSNMSQRQYFQAALDFKARFNLTAILRDAGIVPSETTTYNVSSIRDAVRDATGSTPKVQCNSHANEPQLYQVYQCVGRDGRTPVACPKTAHEDDGGCTHGVVKFPVFESLQLWSPE
ncbi:hypothetical protein ACP70R_004795 [Stipagrostis hirtigluma subsp. patula]